MRLKFWGARGSSPVPQSHARAVELVRGLVTRAREAGLTTLAELDEWVAADRFGKPLAYGGHTPCTEISHGDFSAFVDMGTGLREAGAAHMGKRKDYTFFMTHLHWDHLIGLNFFVPIFIPGHTLTIYHVHKTAPDSFRTLFNGVNFPIKWEALASKIEFRELKPYETFICGDVTATPFALDHPGGSFGYRFEAGGRSAAIGYDSEFKRISREALGRDLPFYQNLDLLVFDAQYDLEELLSKFDWGHASPTLGVDLAVREGIKALALIHHDPWASDQRLRDSLAATRRYAEKQVKRRGVAGQPPLHVFSCYDGLEVEMDALTAAGV